MHVLSAVLLITTATTSAPPLKCGPRLPMPGWEGKPVAILDGRVIPPAERAEGFEGLENGDVESVHIACWDPETGRFTSEPGVPVILIRTKRSLAAARGPLESLVRAQQVYTLRHGRHALTLVDLREAGLEEHSGLELSASKEGWSASTTDAPSLYRCTAGFDAETGGAAVPGSIEVECERRDDLELQAMREAYDEVRGAGSYRPITRLR